MEAGRGKLRDKLEKYDKEMAQTRDRNTYRHASQAISEMTGQSISHTAVWTAIDRHTA
ncbi:MAG: hypothetical protein LBQ95_01975 [Lachnospiraceae bacterium]|nr:hypothetical protein [Lachnospiraceae bacterium]